MSATLLKKVCFVPSNCKIFQISTQIELHIVAQKSESFKRW